MGSERHEGIMRRAYELFGVRDVGGLLELLADDVEWPDVAGGTVLRDKASIRAYWEGQFAVADPRVTPNEVYEVGDDLVAVVDQQVFDLDGAPLTEAAVVYHRYSFAGDRVARMVVSADAPE